MAKVALTPPKRAPAPEPEVQPDGSTLDPKLEYTTKEDHQALGTAFDEFFKEIEDEQAENASDAAKGDGKPVDEELPREEKDATREDVGSKSIPKSEVGRPEAEEDSDAELDAIPEPTNVSPAAKEGWGKLKSTAKTKAKLLKSYEKAFGPSATKFGVKLPKTPEEAEQFLPMLAQKIDALSASGTDPAKLARLEHLEGMARAVGVAKSEAFREKYEKPLEDAYKDVIEDAADLLVTSGLDKAGIAKWKEEMLTKQHPRNLSGEFWDKEIVQKITDRFQSQRIVNKVSKLFDLMRDSTVKAQELTNNAEEWKKWDKDESDWKRANYYREIVDEVQKKHLPTISDAQEWAYKWPEEGVTDPTRLAEVRRHNEEYQDTEKKFGELMERMRAGWPKDHAEFGVKVMLYERAEAKMKTLKSEADDLRKQVKNLTDELDKRKKVHNVPSRPSSPAPAKSKPQTDSLDVHDALNSYDWEGGRK